MSLANPTIVSPDWKDALYREDRNDRRPIRANLANVVITLRSYPELKDAIAYDSFTKRILRIAPVLGREPGPWEDIDTKRLAVFLQGHGINVTDEIAGQGVYTYAHENVIHQLQDYLESLNWDGVERVSLWLNRYLGVSDTSYSRAVGAKFLIAAVARAYKPGCKVDTMLVLEGEQGIGKSSALRILAGERWFTDQLPKLSSKDASIQLQAKWFIEISELDAMQRAEIDEFKAFVSCQNDTYREVYGTVAQDHPRQCVFVGTTNADDYLRDATGNRRFWPIRCTKADQIALLEDRDQLWAEVVALYKSGSQWHLTPAEELLAAKEQSLRYAEDAWEKSIDKYVWRHERVTAESSLRESELALEPSQINQLLLRRVGAHLRRWGWVQKKSDKERYFVRPDQIPPEKADYVPNEQAAFEPSKLDFTSQLSFGTQNDNNQFSQRVQ